MNGGREDESEVCLIVDEGEWEGEREKGKMKARRGRSRAF
jgi:hypothetical protein